MKINKIQNLIRFVSKSGVSEIDKPSALLKL